MMSDYDSQAIIGWQEDETMLYTQKGVREAKPRASPSLALKAASSRLDRRPEKRKQQKPTVVSKSVQASCKSLSIRNYDEEIPDYKDKGPSVPNVRKPLNEPKYRSRKFLRTKVLPNVRLKEVSLWEMVVTPRKRDQSSKEPSNMFMAATHIKNKSAVSFKDTQLATITRTPRTKQKPVSDTGSVTLKKSITAVAKRESSLLKSKFKIFDAKQVAKMLRKKEINWLERQKGEEQRWKYIFGAVKTRKQELHEEIRRREGIMIDKCSRSISPNLTKAQEEQLNCRSVLYNHTFSKMAKRKEKAISQFFGAEDTEFDDKVLFKNVSYSRLSKPLFQQG